MKLNLGCGADIRKGYINIDIRAGDNVVYGDVSNLEYKDNSVDEILAKDIIEHFDINTWENVLREWLRVLKPGGVLIIWTPDVEVICTEYFTQAKEGLISWERLSKIINGGQDYPGNFHYINLSFPWLMQSAMDLGATAVNKLTSRNQNMHVEIIK